jgi:hypothetical protein
MRRPSPCHAVVIRTAEYRNHFSVCVQVAVDLSSMNRMPPGRDFFVWAVMAEAEVDILRAGLPQAERGARMEACALAAGSPEISICRRMRPARAGRIPANSKTIPLRFPGTVAHDRLNRGLLNALQTWTAYKPKPFAGSISFLYTSRGTGAHPAACHSASPLDLVIRNPSRDPPRPHRIAVRSSPEGLWT